MRLCEQCTATTAKGTRCQNLAACRMYSQTLCFSHFNQWMKAPVEARNFQVDPEEQKAFKNSRKQVVDCDDQASDGVHCELCMGITADGKKCGNRASCHKGSKSYCWIHDPDRHPALKKSKISTPDMEILNRTEMGFKSTKTQEDRIKELEDLAHDLEDRLDKQEYVVV